jgi:altronate dehydratase small subunit
MMKQALMVDIHDNVATLLDDVLSGESVRIDRADSTALTIESLEVIPRGFKLATKDINTGQPVIKYGEVIGLATERILKGTCVHVHNIEGLKGRGDIAIVTMYTADYYSR